MFKGSICQEDRTIINIHVSNNKSSKLYQAKTDKTGEKFKNHKSGWSFNLLLETREQLDPNNLVRA
jgi:hypothetical protein